MTHAPRYRPKYYADASGVHLAHPTRPWTSLCGVTIDAAAELRGRCESKPTPRILSCPSCYAVLCLARKHICYLERRGGAQ